jgi:hypothetical protein
MAADAAVLDAVARGASPPTIRVYAWERAAVSVGRFQNVARTLRVGQCVALGLPVVRRVTGGRGVLHGADVTVAVAIRSDCLPGSDRSVVGVHRRIMGGLAHSLEPIGVGIAAGHRAPSPGAGGDCFAAFCCADLVDASGAKVAGSAQCRTRQALLQQVSIATGRCEIAPDAVFRGSTVGRSTALAELPWDAIADAAIAGVLRALGGSARPGDLSVAERRRAGQLLGTVPVDLADLM